MDLLGKKGLKPPFGVQGHWAGLAKGPEDTRDAKEERDDTYGLMQ
jgi:hypothetical protein